MQRDTSLLSHCGFVSKQDKHPTNGFLVSFSPTFWCQSLFQLKHTHIISSFVGVSGRRANAILFAPGSRESLDREAQAFEEKKAEVGAFGGCEMGFS